ncbi:acetylcholinesterase-like isoform X2 [Apostichopus japonicus]|uniref:acetylcholinesterase-like isoform X2 n=1 Tax=Stichopus japonicus TaxID=307972 RepID=UPI003AB627D2
MMFNAIDMFLIILICLCWIGYCSPATGSQPYVTLSDGTVIHGLLDTFESDFLGISKDIEVYYGIPYAEPPVGSLRFKPPTAVKTLQSPYNATEIGNSCVQLDPGIRFELSNANQSEDCLFLDVFVPRTRGNAAAVLVWIHGGGYMFGAGQMLMTPSLPITAFGDIIVVTINYRLSSLGFMTSGDDLIPGNLGLKDQQFALKWVHENIKEFGGDPSRVTIIGESAGSASVGYQILSPGSRGLFRSAIMESGSPISPTWMNYFTPEYHRQEVKKLAELVGCSTEDVESDETLLACLQQAPARELVDKHVIAQRELNVTVYLPITPVVDGEFLEDDPLRLLIDGAINVDKLIIGTNAQEATVQTYAFFPDLNVKPNINSNMADVILSFLGVQYPLLQEIVRVIYTTDPDDLSDSEHDYFDVITQFYTDRHFMCGEARFARHASAFATVYRYTMTFQPSNNFMGLSWAGAAHGDELQYVFGAPFQDLFNGTTEEEKEMSRKTMMYWTNFVKTGNPNTGINGNSQSMPTWPPFTTADEIFKDISPDMTDNVHMKPRECHLIENILLRLKAAFDELAALRIDRDTNVQCLELGKCDADHCPNEP